MPKNDFRHSMRKVPTVRPAVQAQSSYFKLTMTKKSIRSTGVKLASPHLVFATQAEGEGDNLHEIYGLSKFFPPEVRNILVRSMPIKM